MATQVRILAVLFVLFGCFGLVGAFFSSILFGVLATIIGASQQDAAPLGIAVLGLTGVAISVVLVLFALPSILAGYGLWRFRGWGRILAIILAAIALPKVPVGTVFGIYALIILFRKDTEALFARADQA